MSISLKIDTLFMSFPPPISPDLSISIDNISRICCSPAQMCSLPLSAKLMSNCPGCIGTFTNKIQFYSPSSEPS